MIYIKNLPECRVLNELCLFTYILSCILAACPQCPLGNPKTRHWDLTFINEKIPNGLTMRQQVEKLKLKRRREMEENCSKALSAGFAWVPLYLLSLVTFLQWLSLHQAPWALLCRVLCAWKGREEHDSSTLSPSRGQGREELGNKELPKCQEHWAGFAINEVLCCYCQLALIACRCPQTLTHTPTEAGPLRPAGLQALLTWLSALM